MQYLGVALAGLSWVLRVKPAADEDRLTCLPGN